MERTKQIITICPDYDFYLTDGEDVAVGLEELKDKDGRPICLPALDAWAEEMKPVVLASELGQPYDKDWHEYHERGLRLAHQLRRMLSEDYELWYEVPFEDNSGMAGEQVPRRSQIVTSSMTTV